MSVDVKYTLLALHTYGEETHAVFGCEFCGATVTDVQYPVPEQETEEAQDERIGSADYYRRLHTAGHEKTHTLYSRLLGIVESLALKVR